MANFIEDPEETVWIRVPLDSATAVRLQNLSDVCHAAPDNVAASLLRDILAEDEDAHLLLTTPAASAARH
jgi:bacterioferritin (cytochrome b1)